MEVAKVKSWINTNLAPFVWQRIMIKALLDFNKEGLYLHYRKDDCQFNGMLAQRTNIILQELN